jgi:hypothetical protein
VQILVNELAEYPESAKHNPLREALFLKQERNENAPRSAPPPQLASIFCHFPSQVCYLKWWLTKYFGDQEHVFHMFAEMGNEERTGMQSKNQDSRNHSVFVTTPKVGWTGLNFTAANHTAVTLKCCYGDTKP